MEPNNTEMSEVHMETRLGIMSAAAFAGVVIGGLVVADPGVAGSLNPGSVVSGLFGGGDEEDDGYEGGQQNSQPSPLTDATFVSDGNERGEDHDDDSHEAHEDHEDDD